MDEVTEESLADQADDPASARAPRGIDLVPYGGDVAYAFDDTATFDWLDISGTGTELRLADDGAESIELPFAFQLYGQAYDSVAVGANGVLAFADTDKFQAFNLLVPASVADAPAFIAVHWDDLLPLGTTRIVYEVVGDEPFRKLLIQWHGLAHFSNPGADPGITFGVVIEETTGLLTLQYQNMDLDSGLTTGLSNGESATAAIQQSELVGQTYSFNQPLLTDELAVVVFVDGCGADDECVAGCSYDPDCPLCIMDGECNAECDSDPDCTVEECGMDGMCNMACEEDPDCTATATCIADGMCDESCEADPDCENCEKNDVCNPACEGSDPDCDGGCVASGASQRQAPVGLLLLAMMALAVVRRRS
jgi:hypothetical protein